MTDSPTTRAGSTAITGDRAATSPSTGSQDRSLGELVAAATADISTIMRKEVELAKVELKQEAVSAGKGAAGLVAAAFMGFLALIFLSCALAFGLAKIIGHHVGIGFLIVGLLYLVVAGIGALVGKKNLSKVKAPQKTIGTIKDDVAFAKHPTTPPTRVDSTR